MPHGQRHSGGRGYVVGMQHMLAGAVAGMAEHSAMYPVDTIKTRMQALGHPGQQVPPASLPASRGARPPPCGRAAGISPAAAAAPVHGRWRCLVLLCALGQSMRAFASHFLWQRTAICTCQGRC